MKVIISAGGNDNRMYKITKSVSKELLCVYDKPMFYYDLVTLLSAVITESLLKTSNLIRTIEIRQGKKVTFMEEIVFYKGCINSIQLNNLVKNLSTSEYGH